MSLTLMLSACSSAPLASPAGKKDPNSFHLWIDTRAAVDFLDSVCTTSTSEAFRAAWLAHEEKFFDLYWSIYYRHPDFSSERPGLSYEATPRRREICKNARTFVMAAPKLMEMLVPKAREYIGANPDLPFYFVSALQPTDGKGEVYDSRDVYSLNIWRETFSRTTGMVATLFHELIHAAQSRAYPDLSALTPFARSLYREGLAVFAVKQLFPEAGDRATGLNEEQLAVAYRYVASGAREGLKHLVDPNPSIYDMDRYFWGTWRDPVQPPKLGYLIGTKVFESIAASRGVQKTLRLSPAEFGAVIKAELQKIADSK